MEYRWVTIYAECIKCERWGVSDNWQVTEYEHEYDWVTLESFRAEYNDPDIWIIEITEGWDNITSFDIIKEIIDKWIKNNPEYELGEK